MKTNIVFILLAITISFKGVCAPPLDEGKKIFISRCAACHNITKVLVGPALNNVDQRHSIEWIISFVRSSQTLIKNGDKDAMLLFAKFNKIPMPDHLDLTNDDIKNIIAYIKNESKPVPSENAAPFARPSKLHPAYLPITIRNYGFFAGYLFVIAILIMALLMFVRVKEYERTKLNGKKSHH